MAKIIRIRLYRVQDYDLFTLYYDKRFRLKRMMVDALLDYAHGRPLPSYSLKGVNWLPKPEKLANGEKTKTGTKFVITTSISVPDEEKELLDLLEDLAANDLVNIFIKGLVRRCFTDVDSLYISENIREKYKDPGVSGRIWVPEKRTRENPRQEPKATRQDNKKPKESGHQSKAYNSKPQNNNSGSYRQEKKHENQSFEQPHVKPSSAAASLFNMADSYNY